MSERPEDERLERAVDAARRDAELKATAEILALEQNLERERERAARSLEAVQRRLEETESRAVDEGRGTGAAAESADRGRQLLAGRDEAAAALREVQEQLARLERESQGERAGEEARRSERERALLEQSRAELEAQVRRELEGEFAQRISQIKSEADARADEEVAAVGRAAKDAAEAAQRRLDEITEQIEAAGAGVEGAEAKLVEERARIGRQAEERIDAEMRRLQAESDAKIQEALASVETKTKTRAQEEMERQLAGLREEIERLSGAEDRAREEAAEWLQGRTKALQREAEETAEQQVNAARLQEAEKHKAEMRRVAEREAKLAAELDEAARALRAAERRLREAEARAESAERKQPESEQTAEQEAVGPEEPGFLQRIAEARRAKREERDAKRAAREKEAAEKQPSPKPEPARERKASKPGSRGEGSPIDVNLATFEELRALGFSVTHATRVIAYRERKDGFDSVDDLHTVPGLPEEVLDDLKEKLRV